MLELLEKHSHFCYINRYLEFYRSLFILIIKRKIGLLASNDEEVMEFIAPSKSSKTWTREFL